MKEFHKREFDKAVESLESFIEKHPAEREFVDRARMYIELCKSLQKKERVTLKTVDDYFFYAVYKLNQGDHEGALKVLEKAVEQKADEGRIQYLIADIQAGLGRVEEALEALKKAIQKDKQYRILAQNEVDFEPLWEDKRFKALTRVA
ncbi:MAG: tetratricopeptide repeat protein [Candidatus Aminicenantes bacterium]|nr:tetratricopeptide repeat protein [Candidatus Aminicenantes bacterium]